MAKRREECQQHLTEQSPQVPGFIAAQKKKKKEERKEPRIANDTLKGTLKEEEEEKKKKVRKKVREDQFGNQLIAPHQSLVPRVPGVHSLPVVNQQQIADGKESTDAVVIPNGSNWL